MPAADCSLCARLSDLGRIPGDERIWSFPHSVALLGPWQFYQGYSVLVSRTHAGELSQLPDGIRRAFLDEMCLLARAIEECFSPRKLNYELLGNQVPHLHWHLFPRPLTDPDPLRPVWFALDQAERDDSQRRHLQSGPLGRAAVVERLQRRLSELAAPTY